jgi:aminomethyltransferase
MTEGQAARGTALYDRHAAAGARMGEFAGFMMPLWYEGIVAEHLAVRKAAGAFDLSHMGEFFIDGPQAFDLVQWLTCNDVRRIGDGQCQYTLFPTPEGGVVDDLIVYQINPESYMLVVNASNIAKDLAWVNEHNRFDCTVVDRSDQYSLVAVQGPKTDAILDAVGVRNIAAQKQFTFRQAKVRNNKLIVAGTGYTGERGFELIIENDKAEWLWDAVLEAGQPHGIQPIGLGARDTLRLEMGYSLYGHELSDTISPLEANLAWTVRFGPDFVGKEYLQRQHHEGVKRLVTGIVMEDKGSSPRHGTPVYERGGERKIGEVTSGSFSPSLNTGIGMALLNIAHTKPGTEVEVELRNRRLPARVTPVPFFKHHT